MERSLSIVALYDEVCIEYEGQSHDYLIDLYSSDEKAWSMNEDVNKGCTKREERCRGSI